MYLCLIVFMAVNLLWAVWNWKMELDEVKRALKEEPMFRVDEKLIFKVPLRHWKLGLLIVGAMLLGLAFAPSLVVTTPIITFMWLTAALKGGVVKVNMYPAIAVLKLVGDIVITVVAPGALHLGIGIVGGASGVMMTNFMSLFFFVPHNKRAQKARLQPA
jgi:hypothetical protein